MEVLISSQFHFPTLNRTRIISTLSKLDDNFSS